MSYLLFDASRDYDDGCGGLVSLDKHLDYLRECGGTPDCWDTLQLQNLVDATDMARDTGRHLFIVEEVSLSFAGEVNK